jgi:hypothetical protein
MANDEWYAFIKRTVVGPVSFDTLRRMAADGTLTGAACAPPASRSAGPAQAAPTRHWCRSSLARPLARRLAGFGPLGLPYVPALQAPRRNRRSNLTPQGHPGRVWMTDLRRRRRGGAWAAAARSGGPRVREAFHPSRLDLPGAHLPSPPRTPLRTTPRAPPSSSRPSGNRLESRHGWPPAREPATDNGPSGERGSTYPRRRWGRPGWK